MSTPWRRHWWALHVKPRNAHVIKSQVKALVSSSMATMRLQELLTFNNARNCFYLGQTEFAGLPDDTTEATELLRYFGMVWPLRRGHLDPS